MLLKPYQSLWISRNTIRNLLCCANIIEILNRIKPPYNVNGLSQQRALTRLNDIATVKEEIASLLEERERLSKALEEVSFVNKLYSSDTNLYYLK